jgi:hypothetical protein
MIENCIEKGIGLKEPGIVEQGVPIREEIMTLKYLYWLGKRYFSEPVKDILEG